ncbi:uncharacterized protein LOC120665290 isoform X1 [Panicum virgatum]|uniref:uncharacterized protein LOC120665290 isoform X1 n=1 Tax=Panicum virgatum TaxID=38727 RepID=UPI0019D62A36|nr:uncharacterized protein LOC120665290 isoform X1 [Panicum virgatum]
MEAKKKSDPSAAATAGAAAPPPSGYFSSVFSSSPAGNAKDAKQTDLYAMLNKQSSRGQNGNSITGDSKSNGRNMYKDGKHAYPNESSESPYFGSSVHYGGREFYSSSAQKQHANEPPKNYKEGNPDGSATRGDWWQGSLYY